MKAILLIHGFLTGPDDWDGLLPYLHDMYDEVSVFCQPGHSRLTTSELADYKKFTHEASYELLTKELDRLFAAYEIVDVAGHSMGGVMAIWAASKYPINRVCSMSPAYSWPRLGAIQNFLAYKIKRRKYNKAKRIGAYDEAVRDENNRYNDDIQSGLDLLFKHLLPNWSLHNISVLYKNTKIKSTVIAAVTCPVCLMWGKQDELVPPRALARIVEKLSTDDFTKVIYGNFGHSMIRSSSADIVFKDVVAFLKNEKLEDLLPDNPGEERDVLHTVRTVMGGEKCKKQVSLITGSKLVGGKVELINNKMSNIVPY